MALRTRTDALLLQLERDCPGVSRCCLCLHGLPQLPAICSVKPENSQYVCLFCAVLSKACPNRCPPNAVPPCDWMPNVREYVTRPELWNQTAAVSTDQTLCTKCHSPLQWWPDRCNSCHSHQRQKARQKKRKRDKKEDALLPSLHSKRMRRSLEEPRVIPIGDEKDHALLARQIVESGVMTVTERNRLIGRSDTDTDLLQLEREDVLPEQLQHCLQRLELCSKSNRAAQFLARCIRARLLVQHKRAYRGVEPWDHVVSKYTKEAYKLLELAAIVTAIPAFLYWKDAASIPWRSFRNHLSSIRGELERLKAQEPDEFERLWTIRP